VTVSKTFVIVKPDAISRGLIGRIISRFEDKFLRIIAIEQKQKDETQIIEGVSIGARAEQNEKAILELLDRIEYLESNCVMK